MDTSHLHIATAMNLVLHTDAGAIVAAAAYSSNPMESTRIVIGDPLPLRFRVRWYDGPQLPAARARAEASPEGAALTLVLCVASALVGAAACYAWAVGFGNRRRGGSVGAAGAQGIIGNFGARGGYGGYGGPAANGAAAGQGYGGYGSKRKE